MLLLEDADCSFRTLDVPVLVPQARCAPVGGVHGAAPCAIKSKLQRIKNSRRAAFFIDSLKYPVTRNGRTVLWISTWVPS